MKVILAGESVFVSDEVSDKDGQRGAEHTPWKRRQPVRTLVNIGDYPSAEPSMPVRADGSFCFLRCCCVGHSPQRGCALLAPSKKPKSLVSLGSGIFWRWRCCLTLALPKALGLAACA